MLDAEKGRTVNEDGFHDAALLLDLAENREATGRRVRAIDAIVNCGVALNLLPGADLKTFCSQSRSVFKPSGAAKNAKKSQLETRIRWIREHPNQ